MDYAIFPGNTFALYYKNPRKLVVGCYIFL